MEVRNPHTTRMPVKAVLFDFDGTLSTLRCGWEQVMRPLMLEMIAGEAPVDAALEQQVDAYIEESTGIQTIQQMKWLAQTVREHGTNPHAPEDPWWYKAEYNQRLMQTVSCRRQSLQTGEAVKEQYLMLGSEAFLQALKSRGVRIYVASGTDHPDVCAEARALGLEAYFDCIAGAPVRAESCSKEKVIADLMQAEGLHGDDFAVIGDGKVEIRLGREAGARTIGVASDEYALQGVNEVKRNRLIRAGADVIVGDYADLNSIMAFLGL